MVCSNCKSRDIIKVQDQLYCINCGQLIVAPVGQAASGPKPQLASSTPILEPNRELPAPAPVTRLPKATHPFHYIQHALDVAWHGVQERVFRHWSRAAASWVWLPAFLLTEAYIAQQLRLVEVLPNGFSRPTFLVGAGYALFALIVKWWMESYIVYGTAKLADARAGHRGGWRRIAWHQVASIALLDAILAILAVGLIKLSLLSDVLAVQVSGIITGLSLLWLLRWLAIPAVVLGGLDPWPALRVSLTMLRSQFGRVWLAGFWIKILQLGLISLGLASGLAAYWVNQLYGISYYVLLPGHLLLLWLIGSFSLGFNAMYWTGIYHTVVHQVWPSRLADLLGGHTRARRHHHVFASLLLLTAAAGALYFYALSQGNLAFSY
jgi:hypothetical protein